MTSGTYQLERTPKGYEQVTVSTTAVALTVPSGATKAVVKVVAQPARFRDDGVAPTSAVGFLLAADDVLEIYGDSLRQASFIRSGGTNAVLEVLYYSY